MTKAINLHWYFYSIDEGHYSSDGLEVMDPQLAWKSSFPSVSIISDCREASVSTPQSLLARQGLEVRLVNTSPCSMHSLYLYQSNHLHHLHLLQTRFLCFLIHSLLPTSPLQSVSQSVSSLVVERSTQSSRIGLDHDWLLCRSHIDRHLLPLPMLMWCWWWCWCGGVGGDIN